MKLMSTMPSAVDDDESHATPELKHCPSLPLLGSTIPQYSKAPAMTSNNMYDYWPEMTRRFGEFYTMGLPGIGKGLRQIVHIIQDPKEMMKVLKLEGQYPSGAAQSAWGLRKVLDLQGNHAAARIIDQGPEWKRVRSFFQTDLLSPQAARQYVPAIVEAVQYASRGVTQYSSSNNNNNNKNNLNTFCEDASFDMFSSLSMGAHTRITDPDVDADPLDIQFCRAVKRGLSGNTVLTQDPKELILGKMLNIETAYYKQFKADWDEAIGIATLKVDAFLDKKQKGTLTEVEKNSYLHQALQRQEEHGSVTQDECCQLVKGLLGASVE